MLYIHFQVLNKRKGLQWIQNERLPLFLQSQLYAEYRLVKVLSQAKLIRHDKTSIPDLHLNFVPMKEPPQIISSPIREGPSASSSENAMESVYISFGDTNPNDIESWHSDFQTLTFPLNKVSKGSDSDLADVSESTNSDAPITFSSPCISPYPGSQDVSCVMLANMDTIRPEIGPPTYLGPSSKPENVLTPQISPPKKSQSTLHVNNLQELSQMLIAAVMKSAIVEVEGVSEKEVEASLNFQELFPFQHKCSSTLSMDVFKKSVILDPKADKPKNNLILTDLFGYEQIQSSESLILK